MTADEKEASNLVVECANAATFSGCGGGGRGGPGGGRTRRAGRAPRRGWCSAGRGAAAAAAAGGGGGRGQAGPSLPQHMNAELTILLGKKKTALEIRDFLSGEFEPVPLADVMAVLRAREAPGRSSSCPRPSRCRCARSTDTRQGAGDERSSTRGLAEPAARATPRDRDELAVLARRSRRRCCSSSLFFVLAAKVSDGDTEAFDNRILKALRRADDLAVPIGPAWLQFGALDITSLGSPTVLGLATLAVCGFLLLQGMVRTAAFILAATPGGWLLNELPQGLLQRAASGRRAAPARRDVAQLSERPRDDVGRRLPHARRADDACRRSPVSPSSTA